MNLEVIKDVSEKNPEFPSLLFVHGTSHGAWCWKENFIPFFFRKVFLLMRLVSEGTEKAKDMKNFNLLH